MRSYLNQTRRETIVDCVWNSKVAGLESNALWEGERGAAGCDYRSSLFLPLEPPIITGSRWTPKQKRDEKTSYPFLSCINNTMMSLLLRCCLRKANTIPFRWLPLILNILGKCVARHQLTPIVWHWSCLCAIATRFQISSTVKWW